MLNIPELSERRLWSFFRENYKFKFLLINSRPETTRAGKNPGFFVKYSVTESEFLRLIAIFLEFLDFWKSRPVTEKLFYETNSMRRGAAPGSKGTLVPLPLTHFGACSRRHSLCHKESRGVWGGGGGPKLN